MSHARPPGSWVDDEYLCGIYDDALPDGGYVVSFRAYFDESFSGGYFCVAGYVVERDQAKAMQEEWHSLLRTYQLPYFHMVDCAHGAKAFKPLGRDRCIAVEKAAIAIIKKRVTYGYSVVIREDDFRREVSAAVAIRQPYVFCAQMALIGMEIWCRRVGFGGKMAFFFESGHPHQKQANALMNDIARKPWLREYYRYGSHHFVDKPDQAPVQAADILAWQTTTHLKRKDSGNPKREGPRKDFESLAGDTDRHVFMHCTTDSLVGFADKLAEFKSRPQS